MANNLSEIKRLKDLTGVGLTEAKKALEESRGDFDKALELMRRRGLTKAEKRSERETREGMVGTYNHDNRIGVVVEVNCETDFVARNEIFQNLVKDISMQIVATDPEYISINDVPKEARDKILDELTEKAKREKKPENMISKIVENQLNKYFLDKCLLSQSFIKDPKITIEDLLKEQIAKLGENIVIKRFYRVSLGMN